MKASDFNLEPYEPCPCGSAKNYKFCCLTANKSKRHGRFPVGSIIFYGPDDKITTKIAASVLLSDDADAIVKRWVEDNVTADPNVLREIRQHLAAHAVKTVVFNGHNYGCPHEEGEEGFPSGGDCSHCPFWAGKQGSGADPQKERSVGPAQVITQP